MHSVTVTLWPNERKDGTRPIVLRVSHKRKSSFRYTGLYVTPDDWDSTAHMVVDAHPHAKKFNLIIQKKRHKLLEFILDLEISNKQMTPKEICQQFDKEPEPDIHCFFASADEYLERLFKAQKRNQYSSDRSRINHLRNFVQNDYLPFNYVNVSFLEEFIAYLKTSKNLSKRTVMNVLITIRTIFNQAIREQKIEQELYPFGRGKIVIKMTTDSQKQGLNEDELAQFEALQLENEREQHARRLFLFSFYNAGMRPSDVFRLRWRDIQDGRLFYTMGKNDKSGSIKITCKAQAILDVYRNRSSQPHHFIFPELKGFERSTDNYKIQTIIAQKLKLINASLRSIQQQLQFEKKITMYVARHSFATISGDKIPVQLLQKLYRHSSVTTTLLYQQQFISTKTDEALEKVLGALKTD